MGKRTEKTADEAEGARAFNNTVMLLDNGRVHADLSSKLHELVCELRDEAASRSREISGKLTLTLKIAVDDEGVATVTPDVKVESPKPRQARTLLWLSKGGNLVPENPRQQSLPLRDVSGPESRDVNDETSGKTASREV